MIDDRKISEDAVKAAADPGRHWGTPDGNLPVLMKDDRNKMSPITKVEKRIVNGEEDSIKAFYDVAVYIAEGRFDQARGNQEKETPKGN